MWTLVTILNILFIAFCVRIAMAWYCAKSDAASEKYRSAEKRLKKWQKARPFLRIAESAYSRMLVGEMIDAYQKLLDIGDAHNYEHLEHLKQKLIQGPPPYNPVTPPTIGVIFLYYNNPFTIS